MLTAKDIMTSSVITTTKDTPMYKVIDLMLQHQVSGLPVVAEDMTLVGIITEKDILPLFDQAKLSESITVEHLMKTEVVSFNENDGLEDICRCLLENDFRRAPVVTSGKVIGIISRPDITKHILETINRRRLKAKNPLI